MGVTFYKTPPGRQAEETMETSVLCSRKEEGRMYVVKLYSIVYYIVDLKLLWKSM